MIIRELYKTRNDGVNLYKTYSDKNYMIRKMGTDEVYDIAIDVENAPRNTVEVQCLREKDRRNKNQAYRKHLQYKHRRKPIEIIDRHRQQRKSI